jgi:hypothetical protein
MKKYALEAMLESLLIREGKPETLAKEQKYYGDPAKHIKFESETRGEAMEPLVRTKEVEGILRHELENWLRWGRKRDWLPMSFACPLGFLYKSTDVHDSTYRELPCDGIEAAKLERIIVSLPQRHRQAFVMHMLGKAEINGYIRIIKGREDAARILAVQVRQYHNLVVQALNMVLREHEWLQKKDA